MIIAESGGANYATYNYDESGARIVADAAEEKGGAGGAFRPHDLLCAAYASCLNITVRMVLDRMGLVYDKVTVQVDLERTEENTTFLYHVEITGEIEETLKERAIAKAMRCPVRKTLEKPIRFQPMTESDGGKERPICQS